MTYLPYGVIVITEITPQGRKKERKMLKLNRILLEKGIPPKACAGFLDVSEKMNKMDSYGPLIYSMLRQLHEKADKIITLLEVREDAEHGGENGTNTKNDIPDRS